MENNIFLPNLFTHFFPLLIRALYVNFMGILLFGLRMGTTGCFYEELHCCRINIENPSRFPFVPNELYDPQLWDIQYPWPVRDSELGSVDKCFIASLFYSHVRY